jgi:hypothetical protein
MRKCGLAGCYYISLKVSDIKRWIYGTFVYLKISRNIADTVII